MPLGTFAIIIMFSFILVCDSIVVTLVSEDVSTQRQTVVLISHQLTCALPSVLLTSMLQLLVTLYAVSLIHKCILSMIYILYSLQLDL